MSEMKVGFEMRKIELPLESVLPIRKIKDPHNLKRYQAIVLSIREVGMIEPLMVHPQKDRTGTYLLVDGHLRYLALKQLGKTTAECIIAKDDECFTYNNRISRLPPSARNAPARFGREMSRMVCFLLTKNRSISL